MILALIIFLIVFILEISLLHILVQFLKLKGFTGEPVDSTWDELLLDIFTQLVVELKTLLDIGGGIVIVIIRWCLGWREEVEE